MKDRTLNMVLMISGMIGLLVLAVIFDVLLSSLVERNATQGGMEQLLVWLFPLLELLWMLAAVGIIWLFLGSGGYSRVVSSIYLVVGLLVLYSTSFLFVFDFPERLYLLVEYLSPGTLLFQAGAGVAAIGLFSLAMWKPAAAQNDESEHVETAKTIEN